MEFRLSAVENIPPGLQAAVDAVCGKDGQQGNVSRTILLSSIVQALDIYHYHNLLNPCTCRFH